MYKYLELYESFIEKDYNQKTTLDKLITSSLTTSYMSKTELKNFVEFLIEPVKDEKEFNESFMLFGLSILSSHSMKYSFELPILDVYKMFSTDFDYIMKRAEDIYDSKLLEDQRLNEDKSEKYKNLIEKAESEDEYYLSSVEEYREEIDRKLNNIFSAGEDLEDSLKFTQKQGNRILKILKKIEFKVQFEKFLRSRD